MSVRLRGSNKPHQDGMSPIVSQVCRGRAVWTGTHAAGGMAVRPAVIARAIRASIFFLPSFLSFLYPKPYQPLTKKIEINPILREINPICGYPLPHPTPIENNRNKPYSTRNKPGFLILAYTLLPSFPSSLPYNLRLFPSSLLGRLTPTLSWPFSLAYGGFYGI